MKISKDNLLRMDFIISCLCMVGFGISQSRLVVALCIAGVFSTIIITPIIMNAEV
jgi:hypothetical protein